MLNEYNEYMSECNTIGTEVIAVPKQGQSTSSYGQEVVITNVVETYSDLQNYPTSGLPNNSILGVSSDETHNNSLSYYKWVSNNWVYIGTVPGPNTRNLSTISEVHEFDLSATAQNNSTTEDWYVVVDVYIKDDKSTEGEGEGEHLVEYMLYNDVVLRSGQKITINGTVLNNSIRFHNPKTFVLLPTQTLCYKIKKVSPSSLSTNKFKVNTRVSTVEFKDINAVYWKLMVNPTPANSNVFMRYYDTTSSSGFLTVPEYGTANYAVSAYHYDTVRGVITANSTAGTGEVVVGTEKTKSVSLTKLKYFRITTNTPGASIELSAPSSPEFYQEGDEIWIRSGTVVHYKVVAPHYVTEEADVTVTDDTVRTVTLSLKKVRLTVNADPGGCTINIWADGYSQVDNYIEVDWGTYVTYEVSQSPYTTQRKTLQLTPDDSMNPTITYLTENVYLTLQPGAVMRDQWGVNSTSNPPINQIYLRKGIYFIQLVGGGGTGHSSTLPWGSWPVTASQGGGSGAYIYGNIELRDTSQGDGGWYTYSLGSGGKYANGSGQPSEFKLNDSYYLKAGGGSGNAGSGGSPQISGFGGLTGLPGIRGGYRDATISWSNPTPRVNSVMTDTTDGPGFGGGSGDGWGGCGYIKITYVGPLS